MHEFLDTTVKELGLAGRMDVDACVVYLKEILLWNKTHGLTAVVEPHEMVIKHIADSLSINCFLAGDFLADVGSGAGFPGIPLALLFPEKHFTLIESQNKKATFLRHIRRVLKLDNVKVIQQRVETVCPDQKFDGIVTRAFSSLSLMLQLTTHLCSDTGYFLAMKGAVPTEELAMIAKDYPNYRVEKLLVPGLEAERHCVIMNRNGNGEQNGKN